MTIDREAHTTALPVRRHARAARRPATSATGFSLLEILVVVGILTLLISLAVIGFRVVGAASKSRLTGVALENCKSMVGEFTNTKQIENLLEPAPVTTTSAPTAADRWSGPASPGTASALNCTMSATSQFKEQETARVVARLRAVPSNRASIEKTDAARIRYQEFDGFTVSTAVTPNGTLTGGNAVVFLDGSGNPIYFVPGGGLTDVNLEYKGTGPKSGPTAAASYERPGQPIRDPSHLPFWASPGPDGDLTTGDDNEYSFGK